MSLARGMQRALERLWPRSTFWQFSAATVLVGVATALAAMLVALWVSRGLVHKLMEETGYTVLSNAVDFIGRAHSHLDQYRVFLFETDKELLRNTTANALSILEAFRHEAGRGLAPGAAKSSALEQLQRQKPQGKVRLILLDKELRAVVRPQGDFPGEDAAAFESAEGERVFARLARRVQQAGHDGGAGGAEIIQVYPVEAPGQVRREMHLALARYYAPWGLVVLADVDLQGEAAVLREQKRSQLDELRARLGEIVLGRSGYVFALDQDCNIMVHPTLYGANLEDAEPLVDGRSLCRAIQETAIKPWGQNKLSYIWDRAGQAKKYVFPKIAWCTREPITGWYVGASAYVAEVEEDLPQYVLLMFFPALGAILVLGGTLALLLKRLLTPIHDLAQVCQKVSGGDLDATALENAVGEVGVLARHFNVMIRTVRELIRLDAMKQQELELLNKSLESKVQERTRDLKQKTEKLEEANVRLLELDKLKSALLSSVSHELRTPLTSIMGFAKLIERDFQRHAKDSGQGENPRLSKLAKRIDKNLYIINTEAERLTKLINELLDLSSVESGRTQMQDRLFNFADVLGPCLSEIDPAVVNHPDITICMDISDNLPPLMADMERMTQVMFNIVENALKFTQKGQVSIRACSADGWLQVRVRDTGIGVEKKNLMRVFETFHQISADEESLINKPKGSGLGLSLCQSIIGHYGGIIWCESEPGKGTEVIFEIPSATAGQDG